MAGIVAQTKNAVLVSDIELILAFEKNRSSYTSKSFMSAPIILGGRLMGVINVANKNSTEGNVFQPLI